MKLGDIMTKEKFGLVFVFIGGFYIVDLILFLPSYFGDDNTIDFNNMGNLEHSVIGFVLLTVLLVVSIFYNKRLPSSK